MFDDLGELRSLLASAPPSTELFEQLTTHIDFFQSPGEHVRRQIDYVSSIVSRWPSHIDRPVPEMALLAYSKHDIERDEALFPFLTLCNTLKLDHVPHSCEENAVALCSHPLLSRLERVRLVEPHPSTSLIRELIPVLPSSIRHMDLSYTYATEFLYHLLDSPLFDTLEELNLEHANLRRPVFDKWMERVQQMERPGGELKRLYLQGADNDLSDEHVLSWIRSEALRGLEEIDLRHHDFMEAFFEEVASTTALPSLEWIHLSPYLVPKQARALLATSRTLPPPFTRYWRARCQ